MNARLDCLKLLWDKRSKESPLLLPVLDTKAEISPQQLFLASAFVFAMRDVVCCNTDNSIQLWKLLSSLRIDYFTILWELNLIHGPAPLFRSWSTVQFEHNSRLSCPGGVPHALSMLHTTDHKSNRTYHSFSLISLNFFPVCPPSISQLNFPLNSNVSSTSMNHLFVHALKMKLHTICRSSETFQRLWCLLVLTHKQREPPLNFASSAILSCIPTSSD